MSQYQEWFLSFEFSMTLLTKQVPVTEDSMLLMLSLMKKSLQGSGNIYNLALCICLSLHHDK